jgi:hypothetical protein
MIEDIEVQFHKAVDALTRWVTHPTCPNTSKEWRKGYLELDAEARKLAVQLHQASLSQAVQRMGGSNDIPAPPQEGALILGQ